MARMWKHAVTSLGLWGFCATFAVVVGTAGCGDDDGAPVDGGAGDGAISDCPPDAPKPMLTWSHTAIGATPGVDRDVWVELARDFCDVVDITIASSNPAVATVEAGGMIPVGYSRLDLTVHAVAAGTTTLTATWTRGPTMRMATMDVVVTDATLPACSGMASGMLSPGRSIVVPTGTSLAGAAIALQEGASRDDDLHVDPFTASIGCAPDQLPAGYRALGPAVAFGPASQRMMREIPVTIPVRLSLLAAGANRSHVEISYTGPGVSSPRIIGIASPAFQGSPGDGLLQFLVPRLGTYQAVTRTDAPTRRMRTYKFQGVTGFSMGSGGSGTVGMHNLDRFDFVAPLGGPVDWIYMLHYIRTYHLGGFCTAAERAMTPTACEAGASTMRVPPHTELYEHVQDFEHWWYQDGYDGQGGTFDREEYTQIFRDLSMMYGNPNTTRTTNPMEPNITPPGVPDTERMRTDADRCEHPVIFPSGYYDDEYNPDGNLQVITFCDGTEIRPGGMRDVGVWDPTAMQHYPLEVAVAVDVNRNGLRDAGEPVIRAGQEPFDDFGLDGVPGRLETGYDAVTNPDPAGDDYDFQYNPAGTENNWLRDGDPAVAGAAGVAEAFLDVGLDGVMGTPQLDAGGYDHGEGNGRFDEAQGMVRMLERNPRSLALNLPIEALRDVDVFGDGGIRDLFNFGVVQNHMIGGFAARGLPVRYYDSHASLMFNGETSDSSFAFTQVKWLEVGKYVNVRYGDPDASDGLQRRGDGGHVGTPEQLVNRLLSALAWMSARWPDGDRQRVNDQICTEVGPACPQPNMIAIDFVSPTTGRSGPAAIILPPGYRLPENATKRYPIIYLMHGYGMEPTDLIALGVILWTYMTAPTIPEAQRLQKMIFVFPDGLCRTPASGPPECLQGTFYTDAPPGTPGGAQMETWLVDLAEYMDTNYRTRMPEAVPVIE